MAIPALRAIRFGGLLISVSLISWVSRAAPPVGWIRTTDGRDVEGALATASIAFAVDGAERTFQVADVSALFLAAPASESERARIAADLAAIAGDAGKAGEAAEDLADVGLPALTPLLESYQDVDGHQPDPRYRLFQRIVPAGADAQDRTLDMLRLASGETLRGRLATEAIEIARADGTVERIEKGALRRLAVRRARVERRFELQALRDCTYVAFKDSGIAVRPTSSLTADCAGYVRLSFAEDGWATDPDGIHDPLPGKRKLQEGFRWGAVLGRIGASGERFFVGRHIERDAQQSGRLYLVINDNEHWQNNIGGFATHVVVTDAYDLSDPSE